MTVNDEQKLAIFAVATPYAWDVVESAQRASLAPVAIDNHGGANSALPGLATPELLDPDTPFTLGLSSAPQRALALRAAHGIGLTDPHTLTDPTAIVASTVTLGHAVYVNAGAVIASNVSIGCATNVNRSASVGHDNRVGFACSIGPGAILAGSIVVGDGVTIGAGATILPGLTIGEGATVGAGAVVTSSVQPHTVVVGNPARVLRTIAAPIGIGTCPYC